MPKSPQAPFEVCLVLTELLHHSVPPFLIQAFREVPDRVLVHAVSNLALVFFAAFQLSCLPASVALRNSQVAMNHIFLEIMNQLRRRWNSLVDTTTKSQECLLNPLNTNTQKSACDPRSLFLFIVNQLQTRSGS
jgi:hypothetical protein